MPWHALGAAASACHGGDARYGLAENEAANRLARHGPIRVRPQAARSALQGFPAE